MSTRKAAKYIHIMACMPGFHSPHRFGKSIMDTIKALLLCLVLLILSSISVTYLSLEIRIQKLHMEDSNSRPTLPRREKHASNELNSVQQECDKIENDTMYAFGGVVFDSIGKTELQQYVRFKKNNPGFKFVMSNVSVAYPPVDYNYHVEMLSQTDIAIQERNGKAPTRGGSSFLVRSDSLSSQICHYNDFFNGTYMVHCPLPACTCRNVSVWLQYFNFTAYAGNYIPIMKLLWQRRVCNHLKSVPKRLTPINIQNTVTWYFENDGWVARLLSGKKYTVMDKSAFCGCIRQIRKLFCIGASHMRNKCDSIMSLCYKLSPDIPQQHKAITIANVHFINVSRMYKYAQLWTTHLSDERLGLGDVVMIQTGAHDMAHVGMQNTMDESLTTFMRVIGDLQKKSSEHGFRLLVVTTPPFPDADQRQTKGSRNNFAIAAFNRQLKAELLSKKVNVFDEFSVLLARQDSNVCGCHYVCRRVKNNITYITGSVGLSATSMMMSNEIC